MSILRSTIVFGILALGATLAAHYKCDRMYKEYCVTRNVRIANKTDANSLNINRTPVILLLIEPTITYFPPGLMENPPFDTVQFLGIMDGRVPRMHLKPTLKQVQVTESQLESFVITAVDYIQLKYLFIQGNLLTEVPANIEYCKKLEKLHLSANKIQTVNVSVFRGLNKLRELYLDNNQIHSVDATARVRIPALLTLRLDGNGLRTLDMKQWRFPALEHLYLNSNMLYTSDVSAKRFPALKFLHIQDNLWSCTWLKRMFRSFQKKGLNVDGGEDEDCSGPLVRGICCLE